MIQFISKKEHARTFAQITPSDNLQGLSKIPKMLKFIYNRIS